MSHVSDSSRLPSGRDRVGASRRTHRHPLAPPEVRRRLLGRLADLPRGAALALALAIASSSCATPGALPSDSVDFVLPSGARAHLGTLRGRVVIVDVCASWASACNLNARVLDEVVEALPGAPLEVVTVLLDDGPLATEAQRTYVEVLGVKHLVALAGSRVRAGTSALGERQDVPRLLVVDREGRIVIDEVGGVVSVQGLVERVRPLLGAPATWARASAR